MKAIFNIPKFSGYIVTRIFFIYIMYASIHASALEMPSSPGPVSFSNDIINAIKSSGRKGIISTFKADSKFNASDLQLTYYSNTSDELTGEFLIGNYTTNNRRYTLTVLVDYKPKEFSTNNGKSSALYHTVIAPNGKNTIIPITINKLTAGAHDVIIMAIDKERSSDTPRMVLPVLYHRANFFVMHDKAPVTQYHSNSIKSHAIQHPIVVINKSSKVEDFSEKSIKSHNTGKNNYYIHINNELNVNSKYALFAINADSKTPIITSNNKLPRFYTVGAKQSAMLPLYIAQFKTGDRIRILLFREPFVRLEKNHGKMNNIRSELIYSNRIVIN